MHINFRVFFVAFVAFCLNPILSFHPHAAEATNASNATLIIVVGAAGEEEFGNAFTNWATSWRKAGEKGGANTIVIGLSAQSTNSTSATTTTTNVITDRDLLKQTLEKEPKEGVNELWMVLIGHGTFDGKKANFNLRGPDFDSGELAEWIKPFKRPVAVVDCSSSSGPFLKALSGTGHAVVTSTRNGGEHNYSRFGRYMAESLSDPLADLDKDGQTSLLELFLSASAKVAEFYKSEGRLATEHSLLDDNGDGLGTPPEWFRGIRAVKKSTTGALPDGLRAHQFHLLRSEQEQKMSPETRARRDELEIKVESVREKKSSLTEDEYYAELEKIMLELARLYEKAEAGPAPSPSQAAGIPSTLSSQNSHANPLAKVIDQAADRTVSLHASNVTIHGTTVRYEPQPHKNTIGYWSRAADWVSWDFNISKPGKFNVEMLQGCGKGSGGSEYTISVGEQILKDVVPDTGAFSNFVTRTVGILDLNKEGPYTLAVKPQTKPGVAVMDLRLITLKPLLDGK